MQLLSRSTATPDAAEVAAALESRKLADVDRVTVYRTLNACWWRPGSPTASTPATASTASASPTTPTAPANTTPTNTRT